MSALHIKGFQKVILNYLLYTICVPISKYLEIGIHGSIYVWSPFCLFTCANGFTLKMCQREACCKTCAAEILGELSVTVSPFVQGLLQLGISAFSSQTESFLFFSRAKYASKSGCLFAQFFPHRKNVCLSAEHFNKYFRFFGFFIIQCDTICCR